MIQIIRKSTQNQPDQWENNWNHWESYEIYIQGKNIRKNPGKISIEEKGNQIYQQNKGEDRNQTPACLFKVLPAQGYMGRDADCQGEVDPEIERNKVFCRENASKKVSSKGEDFCQHILVRPGRFEGKVVGNLGKGVWQEKVHSENKGCGPAEDRAHAYEKVSYILVKAFWIPAMVNVSKDSVFCFTVEEFEPVNFVPENVAHQQVPELMDGSAYPGCGQNSFPAKGSLDVEVGTILKKAEYYACKNKRACNIESFEQAYPENREEYVIHF